MIYELLRNEECGPIDDWDRLLTTCPRGHYTQLSTWLRSFEVYGAMSYVLVARNRDRQIIGGMGFVRFGLPWLGVLVGPIGPILHPAFDGISGDLIREVAQIARSLKCALLQFQVPASPNAASPFLLPIDSVPITGHSEQPSVDFAQAPGQMLWIDFQRSVDGQNWADSLLHTFSESTRRNIRLGISHKLRAIRASSFEEIRRAYSLIEANGRDQGYPVRRWEDFGPTLVKQVQKGQAVVHLVEKNGDFLAANYSIVAGQRLSYIMGGTVRVSPDLRAGHFSHWAALCYAREQGLLGYDLTSGGSAGVMRFKMGFRPIHIRFVPASQLTLAPARAALLRRGLLWASTHKAGIAVLASALRRFLPRS